MDCFDTLIQLETPDSFCTWTQNNTFVCLSNVAYIHQNHQCSYSYTNVNVTVHIKTASINVTVHINKH